MTTDPLRVSMMALHGIKVDSQNPANGLIAHPSRNLLPAGVGEVFKE
jgi:hypothetical protein